MTKRNECTAQLKHRGVVIECESFHPYSWSSHENHGVYWEDGETEREQCPSTVTYCAETLRCDSDADRCRNGHGAHSVRYGDISWSEQHRPQPALMAMSLGCGHRFGSYEADAQMCAAATMQDAANRLELLRASPAERAFLLTVEQHGLGPGVGECQEAWAAVVEERER